jgi:diketogulonate reductase-like aldo/keto reductase
LSALDLFPVDLRQIRLGFGSFSSIGKHVQAMRRLVERGTIRAVGVSNFSARQMEIAHATLAEYGIPLASNQIQLTP